MKSDTAQPRGATRDETWVLTFTSVGGNTVPMTCRIKKLLKAASWYGLRCTAAIEQPNATPDKSPQAINT
jgi:hypothetical protein